MTYDAAGPRISGCATSGCDYHPVGGTSGVPLETPSLIVVVPSLRNGAISLSFSSVRGVRYALECKDAISASQWAKMYSIFGTGEALSLRDSDALSPSRFYRIRTE